MLQLIPEPLRAQSIRNAYTHANPAADEDCNRDLSLTGAAFNPGRHLIQIPRGIRCAADVTGYTVAYVKRAYWLDPQTVRVVMRHLASAGGYYNYDLPLDVIGPFKRVQYVTVSTTFSGVAGEKQVKTAAIAAVNPAKAFVVPVVQSGCYPKLDYAGANDGFALEKLWLSAADQVSAQFKELSTYYTNLTLDLAVVEL